MQHCRSSRRGSFAPKAVVSNIVVRRRQGTQIRGVECGEQILHARTCTRHLTVQLEVHHRATGQQWQGPRIANRHCPRKQIQIHQKSAVGAGNGLIGACIANVVVVPVVQADRSAHESRRRRHQQVHAAGNLVTGRDDKPVDTSHCSGSRQSPPIDSVL